MDSWCFSGRCRFSESDEAIPTYRRDDEGKFRMADAVKLRVGPADRGRPMSLEEFYEADSQEGYVYELAKGMMWL
jgi:hypothetical protein